MSEAKKETKWPREVKANNVSVKVYRVAHPSNKTGWSFVLVWHSAKGRQRQKFADEGQAMEEARLKAGQLAAGRIEGADMSRGDRDELQAARKLAGNVPVLAALEEWAKARELTEGNIITASEAWAARNRGKFERTTVAVVIAAMLKEKKKRGLNTEENHGSILDVFKTEFGALHIDSLSSVQLSAYLSKIANPVTLNTHRKRMVTVWRWAQKKGYLPRDVKTEAELTERAREPDLQIGIISAEKFQTLLEFVRAADPSLLPAIILSGFCGMRRVEVHGQKWEDVDLAKKHVRVSAAKRNTPARRLIPLSAAAVEWFMLCGNRKGDVSTGLSVDRLRKLCIGAGHKLPENCFRHAYITHSVAATQNVPQVALNSGNSVKIIHKHYLELVTKAEGEEWSSIRPKSGGEVIAMTGSEVSRG